MSEIVNVVVIVGIDLILIGNDRIGWFECLMFVLLV